VAVAWICCWKTRDDDSNRYEVEIQLGETDESHIIRTIEYWDREKKRWPLLEHTAVIVAETITGRFLNVIRLFNGAIPLIALQMQAVKFGNLYSLIFSTVMDVATQDNEEDEEETGSFDRAYWLDKASAVTLGLADKMLSLIKSFDPAVELKYNKHYIGLARDGGADNYVSFQPKKNTLNVRIKLAQFAQTDAEIDNAGLVKLTYVRTWGLYMIRVALDEAEAHYAALGQLFRKAYAASSIVRNTKPLH